MSADSDPTLDNLDVTIELAALREELWGLLGRYVIFPSPAAHIAVTLWIAATHAQPAWEHAARLILKSPEKRCGKSRLLDLIEATSYRPLVTVNISPAALVRSIDAEDPPTILVDEADSIFGSKRVAEANEDLRGILNAGHQRGRTYKRWDMRSRKVEESATYAMAALAGIGDQPATIEDRGISISMRRRAPGEEVAPFRTRRDVGRLHELRDRLNVSIRARLDDLTDAIPNMPVEDRAADTWEPLMAIADLAGGRWPAAAQAACIEMATSADTAAVEGSAGVKLLEGVRDAFRAGEGGFLSTASLVATLRGIEDAPWCDSGLTANNLARKLAPFDIRPRPDSTGRVRGYRHEDCLDAFKRYLPDADPGWAQRIDERTRR